MKRSIIVEAILVLYIILFLYTGISKILDFSVFKEQIATSPILAPISSIIAVIIPITEFSAVLLLIIPRWRIKGLLVAMILMCVFTVYILAMLIFNDKLPCSCGGVIELMSWKQHIIFNSFFILLAITGMRLELQIRKAQKKDYASIKAWWSYKTNL